MGGNFFYKSKFLLQNIFESTIAGIIFVLIWEILPRFGLVDTYFLPPFSDVVKALFKIIKSGELFVHLTASFQRVFLGYLSAVLVAVPLGIVMGSLKRFEKYIDPLFQTFRNISVMALFPVFILLFGIGESAKVAIIFWGTIWPTLLNTIGGVKNVDPLLIKSARSMGISRLSLFRKITLPAASPSILTGIRLSASLSVIILVAAEMIGANEGLGFLIFYAEQKYVIPEMYAGILSLALLGLIINYGLVALEKKLTKWKEQPTE